jgi:predicted nucleic acid-binding protein
VTEPAVVNASPLIYLARGGCFDLLQVASDQVVVPTSVDQELRRRGRHDPAVQAMDQAAWLVTVADPPIPQIVQAWHLGAGESAVLAWAQSHPGAEAVIDDLAARKCAAAIGVPVRGTLGIVLAAKRRNLIPLARPLVERLLQSGMYLSDSLMNGALALVGE